MTTQRDAILRPIVAALPPAIVLLAQLVFWNELRPYAWFLFVPAVLLSAWIGGLWAGVVASAVTTVLVWWLFVPPEGGLSKEPRFFVPAMVYLVTGVVLSAFRDRLQRATRQASDALAEVRAKNVEVTRLYEKTKELDELKTQLFSNVSHELRTPLSIILGVTEKLLESPALEPGVRDALSTVGQSARLLRRHVDQLLDVAKLEVGQMQLDRVDVDVARHARLVADPFVSVARERGITVAVEGLESLHAEVDLPKLESVLTNLLSNAVKFTPEGGRVRMSISEAPGGERVVFEIADSGPGIPPDKREVVFERFRQLEGGATRAAGGTGLGLAIARDLVVLHGGTISAGTAPEGGALLRVELPRRAPAAASARAPARGTSEPSREARQLADELRPAARTHGDAIVGRPDGALVLVVEDSPDMNRFLCDTLAKEHRVAAAFDGSEGLAKAVALRPDLVLTDVMMPGMSGEDLVRAIRRIARLEDTPVVVLTARADDDLLMRVLREGALDYLMKPFTADELRARVDNALARRRIERELGQSRADLTRAQAVAQIGSWRLDVQRNVLVWSAENYRIFGVPEGTPMTYEAFLAIVHPDDRAYVDRMWSGALAGEPYDIEHRIIAAGQEKWVRERAELLFDDRGQLLGGIGTTQDVTDRKRIEDALRAAEQGATERTLHIRKLLDASIAFSDAVAALPETNLTTVMGAVAAQARTLVGAEYAAIGLGTDPTKPFDPWVQVGMHPEIARRLGRPPRPVGTLGVVSREHRELRVRDVRRHPGFRGFPPGHPVMTSFLGVPIRFRGISMGHMFLANKRGADEFTEEDQQVVELLAARAGTALESVRLYDTEATERAWMQTVVDQMPEGLLLVDARGVVTMENRNLRALSRTETDEYDEFGNPIRLDLCLPSGERVAAGDLPYVRALREGESFSGREHVLRQPDGRLVPVLVSVTPVTRGNGARSGAVMIVQDITYLKELERLREEWTSVVAHDLRQPVNTISVHAALLDDTDRAPLPDERRRRAVSSIRASVKALDRMIHDLLDASRIDASRLSVERRETSMPALVRDLLERWPDLADCCVLEAAPGSEHAVLADGGRVEQVLGNLLSNAQKYGEPGAPIHIALLPRPGELEVIVTNRGAGIPAEELPRLFRRFERSRVVRERGIPGIGLGLYVSKGLVEAQGGRIWVESTPGETTGFHFTLPFAPRRRVESGAARA